MTDGEILLDDQHRYTVDGRRVPGVTNVMREVGAIDTRWSDQEALDRGTAVHIATEFDDQGDLDDDHFRAEYPDWWPYVEAYRKFKREASVEILDIERHVYHAAYQYCGTLDRIARINGYRSLLDIKTGAKAPWHHVQTAGYMMAWTGFMYVPARDRRHSVYLHRDGTYHLDRHTKDKVDGNAFLSFLSTYNWLKSNGGIR